MGSTAGRSCGLQMELAATATGVSVLKVVASNHAASPAIAFAVPVPNAVSDVVRKADDCQAGESQSGDVLSLERSDMALVICLLLARSPTAVARLVVPIVVDAINGCTGWTRAHVSQEGVERLPSPANRNSATAVILVADASGIRAALMHGAP